MKKKFNWLLNKKTILILFAIFAVLASIQSLLLPDVPLRSGGDPYKAYNNYVIFKQSFHHLINNQDLYIHYPQEQGDLYKYTPTFSVFFGIFALLPDWIGLNLWNLLNALVLFIAIWYLPVFDSRQKSFISLTVLIELMTSMQNEQSNGLIAGLLVLAFGLLENKKYFWATLSIMATAFIKLFGIVGLALLLFYPKKWKLALYTALSTLILFLIPLIFVDFNQYISLFESYGHMLTHDHDISYGFSVMGWLNSWFGLSPDKNMVVLAGIILFLVPLAKFKSYKIFDFRLYTLVSVLIWIIIFNHKAESATFVIAMTGAAIWFIRSEKSILNIILLILAMVFTSLSPTDIFPPSVRQNVFIPYAIKAVPCILIWGKLIYDMMVLSPSKQLSSEL